MDQSERLFVLIIGFTFDGVATSRAPDTESGIVGGVGGVVFLPLLLLRVLRDPTLHGPVLSILWSLVVYSLFDMGKKAGTVNHSTFQRVFLLVQT